MQSDQRIKKLDHVTRYTPLPSSLCASYKLYVEYHEYKMLYFLFPHLHLHARTDVGYQERGFKKLIMANWIGPVFYAHYYVVVDDASRLNVS